ncbi:MAG: Uncharacterised protein [Flavobacteriaceae bacterium]|nr:MAG: Uncharacterised protein [Flavobacteriaceae bacterium]
MVFDPIRFFILIKNNFITKLIFPGTLNEKEHNKERKNNTKMFHA